MITTFQEQRHTTKYRNQGKMRLVLIRWKAFFIMIQQSVMIIKGWIQESAPQPSSGWLQKAIYN
jgi:hypothetical protein